MIVVIGVDASDGVIGVLCRNVVCSQAFFDGARWDGEPMFERKVS